MGELCLLGYPIMTIPFWDKFGHKSGRLFHLRIYQARKVQIHKKIYPSKGEGTPATARSKKRVTGQPHPRPKQENHHQKP